MRDSLGLRLAAILTLWFIGSMAVFQMTVRFGDTYINGLYYVFCAACGALGLFIAKFDRVASLIMTPVLAAASVMVVWALRLGYFGL